IVTAQIAIAAQRLPGIPVTSIASTRISLAYRLSESGQHEKAASELQQAVESLEQLYLENSRSAERLLAQAQNNYAGALGELGLRAEALQAAKRACELYEMMDSRNPGSCQAELATSWQVLSTMLAAAGQRRESLEPVRKALAQREAMAEKVPGLLPSIASSLNTLAIRLVEVGELPEALLLVQRAVRIRSDL
ncbi:MAG: tetratricopeptide repeat protein, partial [Planctomycetaceae bacterium]